MPGEAEAELAMLNGRGLIDAVITSDSDVFVFGAMTVYHTYVFLSILMKSSNLNTSSSAFQQKTDVSMTKFLSTSLHPFQESWD